MCPRSPTRARAPKRRGALARGGREAARELQRLGEEDRAVAVVEDVARDEGQERRRPRSRAARLDDARTRASASSRRSATSASATRPARSPRGRSFDERAPTRPGRVRGARAEVQRRLGDRVRGEDEGLLGADAAALGPAQSRSASTARPWSKPYSARSAPSSARSSKPRAERAEPRVGRRDTERAEPQRLAQRAAVSSRAIAAATPAVEPREPRRRESTARSRWTRPSSTRVG